MLRRRGMLVAMKTKADWNRAADPPVVGPVWVGVVLSRGEPASISGVIALHPDVTYMAIMHGQTAPAGMVALTIL